jgi:hypothetical protein
MLRWTSRFRDHLASQGMGTQWPGWWHIMEEAELAAVSVPTTEAEASTTPQVPSTFDFQALTRLLCDSSERPWVDGSPQTLQVRPFQSQTVQSELTRSVPQGEPFGGRSVDILWVSDREFVSMHTIEKQGSRTWVFSRKDYYSMEVSLRDSAGIDSYLELSVYTIDEFNSEGGPPPDAAPKFLAALLTPVLHKVCKIQVTFHQPSALPADSILSLVPTNTQSVTEVIDVVFNKPHISLVQALSTHPFHPKVRLDLRNVLESQDRQWDDNELNDNLREYQYLRHLVVPRRFLPFESSGTSFSENSAFESFTLDVSAGEKMSSTMLQGAARNKNLKQLTVMLDARMKPKEAQAILEQFSSATSSAHSLSCVHFLPKPGCRHDIVMKSNGDWDSKFLPVLVVNWMLEHQKRLAKNPLGGRVAGMVIRAVNRSVPLANATNVVSLDPGSANTSAIFYCLHRAFSKGMIHRESSNRACIE